MLGVANSGSNALGVSGVAASGTGVLGTGGPTGVQGSGTTYGVYGVRHRSSGYGVYGSGSYGVVGSGSTVGAYGSGSTYGVYGTGPTGVLGVGSGSGYGVWGYTSSGSGYGVYGQNTGSSGKAVYGAGLLRGLRGHHVWRLWGATGTPPLQLATGSRGTNAGTGYAGVFSGAVYVSGFLTKAGGGFKIDHPLEPDRRYLVHSFVEAPEMLNVYSGTAKLDGRGRATVRLPRYFDAENKDFRYQLTAIGRAAPDLHVARGVVRNRFSIAGGAPGQSVCWQVTGVRQDAWAKANPMKVEPLKSKADRGKYLQPKALGKPRSAAIHRAAHPRRAGPEAPEGAARAAPEGIARAVRAQGRLISGVVTVPGPWPPLASSCRWVAR